MSTKGVQFEAEGDVFTENFSVPHIVDGSRQKRQWYRAMCSLVPSRHSSGPTGR